MRDFLMFVAGLFVSFLPPRYRSWWPTSDHDSFARTVLVCGVIQFVASMLIFLVRLINFGQGSTETGVALIRAADASETGRLEIPTPAVGSLMLAEFIFHPVNMFLFYMAFEGMIRAVAALASGERLGTIPLYAVSGVHGLLNRARFKRELGPLVVDEMVRGTPRSDYDLKVYSCRPKLHWNPYVTIGYEDQFYQMFREEPGQSPRRFIYYLRKNPVGRVVVRVYTYNIDDILKEGKKNGS